MKTNKQWLLAKQADQRLKRTGDLKYLTVPRSGWVKYIRLSLGLSLRQLGSRMGISAQSAKEIENRELASSITLRSLQEAADALGMKLVYGFVPKNKGIQQMIEERAHELAKEIVERTHVTMALENQARYGPHVNKAIKQKKEELLESLSKKIWD